MHFAFCWFLPPPTSPPSLSLCVFLPPYLYLSISIHARWLLSKLADGYVSPAPVLPVCWWVNKRKMSVLKKASSCFLLERKDRRCLTTHMTRVLSDECVSGQLYWDVPKQNGQFPDGLLWIELVGCSCYSFWLSSVISSCEIARRSVGDARSNWDSKKKNNLSWRSTLFLWIFARAHRNVKRTYRYIWKVILSSSKGGKGTLLLRGKVLMLFADNSNIIWWVTNFVEHKCRCLLALCHVYEHFNSSLVFCFSLFFRFQIWREFLTTIVYFNQELEPSIYSQRREGGVQVSRQVSRVFWFADVSCKCWAPIFSVCISVTVFFLNVPHLASTTILLLKTISMIKPIFLSMRLCFWVAIGLSSSLCVCVCACARVSLCVCVYACTFILCAACVQCICLWMHVIIYVCA